MSALTVNRRRMNNVMLRPQAVRTWNQPAYADRGEATHVQARWIRDCNARGEYVRDFSGKVITTFDGLPDSDFATGGPYFEYPVDIPWQDWMDLMLAEDDVCYAFLGVETARPSAANGGYELHIKSHTPKHGRWTNLYWATTYAAYKPYRAATGSNRIIDVHEVNGACTVTLIDPADGNRATITANMLTDSDDLSARPACQTGNVAMYRGTIDTTQSTALRLAGHINEPIYEALKIGGSTSQSYDPAYVRTRWTDGKTWNLPYIATCYNYGTNYYEVQYKEGGQTIYDGIPVYYSLTREGGMLNRVDGKVTFSQGKRPFKAVFDDGIVVDTEVAG